MTTNKLWGIKDVAEYLGIPEQTLYQWRTKGYGPPGRRVGKYVKYQPADVIQSGRLASDCRVRADPVVCNPCESLSNNR